MPRDDKTNENAGVLSSEPILVVPHIGRILVFVAGRVIANTKRAKAVSMNGGAPVIYVPKSDISEPLLKPKSDTEERYSTDVHFDVVVSGQVFERAASNFLGPSASQLVDHLTFDGRVVEIKHLPVYLTERDAGRLEIRWQS